MAADTDFPTQERESAASSPQPLAAGGGRRGVRGPVGRSRRDLRVPSIIKRSRNFYREVISELRKVIYPTRTELITYVVVVFAFVSFMVASIAGLDYVFTQLDLHVFG